MTYLRPVIITYVSCVSLYLQLIGLQMGVCDVGTLPFSDIASLSSSQKTILKKSEFL